MATTDPGGVPPGWDLLADSIGPGEAQLRTAGIPGDLNGDGPPELLVVRDADGSRGEVELRLYAGHRDGFKPEPVWRLTLPQGNVAEPRFALACLGPGTEGSPGFCVGIPGGRSARGDMPGRVFVFRGRPAPDWAELIQELGPSAGSDRSEFGFSLVTDADLDGDQRPDLVVGMPGHPGRGRVVCYPGSARGFGNRPLWVLEGTHADDRFGTSLACLPDFDGDGRADLAVGVPGWNGRYLAEGCVAVISGVRVTSGPVDAIPHLKLHGGRQSAGFGRRVVSAGDVNGDGLSDVVATSTEVGHRPNRAGRMEVVHGWRGSLERLTQYALTYPDREVVITGLQRKAPVEPETKPVRWRWWMAPLGSGIFLGLLWGAVLWGRSVRERERRRIAEDLHDEIGVQLHRLGAEGAGSVTDTARESSITADAARAVRVGIERVIWSIDPQRRTWADLACGLTDLADEVLKDSGIRCRYEIPATLPQGEFEPKELDALYRIAQEALTNVRKHSRASQVVLRFGPAPEGLGLEIADNGVGGCPVPDGRPASGHGLVNMRARIRRVGGECAWREEPGGGTRVVVTLPTPR